MPLHAPSRFLINPSVRARFGERAERLGPRYFEGDPPADEAFASIRSLPAAERNALVDQALQGQAPGAPAPLLALVEAGRQTPFWVDFPRVDRGGATFLRTGLLGGLLLGCYSLTASYCSPAGNKPLTFSGRLEEEAPRRLAETGRFVQLVAQPGALLPGGPGWCAALKVRLMHAAVRAFCAASPRWDRQAWGVPINAPDIAGTGLLFSWVILDGLDRLGLGPPVQDREDLMHQWRYVSWLLGAPEDLLWSCEADARWYWELLLATQGDPDQDARRLAQALFTSGARAPSPEARARARRMAPINHALSRFFLGDEIGDKLGLERNGLRFVLPSMARLLSGSNRLLHQIPPLRATSVERGARYWQFIVDQGLQGVPAEFSIPERFRGAPPP
ncbi:MAG: DUF2236 domain-containing protein [Polyangiaceae bacterium]|nr:DUF2236 domain-containing protein [Polyangiaceae bacterium]